MKLAYWSVLIIEVFLTGTGCSNRKTEVPGKPCVINTDCKDPLSCSWGICHEACRGDNDCAGGAHCVWDRTVPGNGQDAGEGVQGDVDAGAEAVRVCLLSADDDTCKYNSVCPFPLVCGRDLHCRNECMDSRDCANLGDMCVVGGMNGVMVCAEPAVIDNNGELTIVERNPAVDAGVDAAPGTDTSRPDVAGPDKSVAGDAGGDVMVVPESEPNEDQASATPFTPGTQVNAAIDSATDIDTYVFTAPADPAGGFYQGSFTNIGGGAISFKIISAANNGVIQSLQSATVGQSRYFFWAAAPGQTYYVVVDPITTTIFNYTLKVDFTPVKDDYEPNDMSGSAKKLDLETPVLASMFAGFQTSTFTATQYQDWYFVDLAAGPTTIAIPSVPNNVRLRVGVSNATTNINLSVTGPSSPNAGAAVNGMVMIATAGKYNVVIDAIGVLPVTAGTETQPIPDSFVSQYQLTISQP